MSKLPLDKDPEFMRLAKQRADLLSKPGDHSAEIKAIEEAMNRRAFELAKELGLLPRDAVYAGDLTSCLRPIPGVDMSKLPLDKDPEFMRLAKQRADLLSKPGDHSAEIKAIEEAMNRRAFELAKELGLLPRDAVYAGDLTSCLRPIPGVDMSKLPLDKDPEFMRLAKQRADLLSKPGDHSAEIKAIEDAMNRRAFELAKELGLLPRDAVYAGDLTSCLRPIPGVDMSKLPLDKDPEFMRLAKQRADLLSKPDDHSAEIKAIEEAMNRRAFELAKELGLLPRDAVYAGDLTSCLRPIPGVDMSKLPLDKDPEFMRLAKQRADLLSKPGDHSAEIKAIEDAMNRRAFELAKELGLLPRDAVYAGDLTSCLRPIPGVDMSKLPLDKDPEFMRLAKQRADLLSKPGDHSAEIKAIEDAMNRRAFELAKELGLLPRDAVYAGDLTSCLRPIPGVDMSKLPLDKDPEFMRLAKQRADLLSKPGDHSAEIKAIEDAMNRRAFELAKELGLLPRDAVYAGDLTSCLRPIPGVDMSKLPLDKDPEFMRLAKQRADLLSKPGDHSAEIKAIEEAMNRRAFELAKELGLLPRDAVYAGDLTSCLRPIPGVDMSKLPLDKDPEFMRLAKQRADLLSKPGDHSAEIKAIEEAMNRRAFELAKELGLLPRDAVYAGDDVEMQAYEAERARLLRLIAEQEELEKERAHNLKSSGNETREMERVFPGEDWDFVLENYPKEVDACFKKGVADVLGVPSDSVKVTKAKLGSLHMLFKVENPREDEASINRKVGKHDFPELMDLYQSRMRNSGGEAASLRSQLEKLEAKMSVRARELANAEKYPYLRPIPGVDMSKIPLDQDPEFMRLAKQRADLLAKPGDHSAEIKAIEEAMNRRAFELAKKLGLVPRDAVYVGDFSSHLRPIPGVDVSQLPLDQDPEYRQLQERLAALLAMSGDHSEEIKEVLEAMNRAAWRIAKEQGLLPLDAKYISPAELPQRRQRKKGRKDVFGLVNGEEGEDFFNLMEQEPLGVPLDHLMNCFQADEEFNRLVELFDESANQEEKEEAVDAMNYRAEQFAEVVHNIERDFLGGEIDGLSMSALPLNTDEQFLKLETEARDLRFEENGEEVHAERLEEIDDLLYQRACEIVKEVRAPYVSDASIGMPVDLLNLKDKPGFIAKEEELRRLKRNPRANRDSVAYLEEHLAEKAKEMSDDLLRDNRTYLDEVIEDINVRELPLAKDPAFRADEALRAKLLCDPVGQRGGDCERGGEAALTG
ncbi:hypothetical protein, conserved [Angomonas deanei]|uniref:Calpain-like cysteine peptidase n=1 Tax=Angomonas deanei TaxID=59799 RepID=A0A7G2C0F5_9TRYP|nr:hypothetical protein, conserved [Angomonas deanei]